MSAAMTQTIHFQLIDDDIIIATPIWSIKTVEDCDAWYQQWVDYLTPFHRKMDCVMILNDFHVSGQVGRAWGERRAMINNTLLRHSFRVNSDMVVSSLVQLSGVLYDAATGEAKSIEAAIQGIHARRQVA
jgi:hypothetical protein